MKGERGATKKNCAYMGSRAWWSHGARSTPSFSILPLGAGLARPKAETRWREYDDPCPQPSLVRRSTEAKVRKYRTDLSPFPDRFDRWRRAKRFSPFSPVRCLDSFYD